MKVFLMYKDRDFNSQYKLSATQEELCRDLELETLFAGMATGDEFLFSVAQKAVLSNMYDEDSILYRQDILKDGLENQSVVRDLYDIAVKAIEGEKKHYLGISRYPDSILRRSIECLQMYVGIFKELKHIADIHAGKFQSDGFTTFFEMIKRDLNEEYLNSVQEHLRELKFDRGVFISADLGKGNQGYNYRLRKIEEKKRNWIQNIIFTRKLPAHAFYISDRDESGHRAIRELRNRGINLAANALAQSNDHILSFFSVMRVELAFYIGCLNLYEHILKLGKSTSFPVPMSSDTRNLSYQNLYDVCLALTSGENIVGNHGNADDKNIIIITGANQGGKSTFLRSIGVAQIMMQCGMFVPADYFRANVCNGIFTHFRKEEDSDMNSGKLDEELSRMSDIVDQIRPDSLILFNESFAATNDREGSQIANGIVRALSERHIKIFYVTHLYEFANDLYQKGLKEVLCLRAERQAGGKRTFRIIKGEPLQTSYGHDLYEVTWGRGN